MSSSEQLSGHVPSLATPSQTSQAKINTSDANKRDAHTFNFYPSGPSGLNAQVDYADSNAADLNAEAIHMDSNAEVIETDSNVQVCQTDSNTEVNHRDLNAAVQTDSNSAVTDSNAQSYTADCTADEKS